MANDGSLVGTTLQGTYRYAPSHPSSGPQAANGSALWAVGGAGDAAAAPLLTLGDDATVSGLFIAYPHQHANATPTPYPWTVLLNGNNAAVLDCELLNPYAISHAPFVLPLYPFFVLSDA